MSSPTAPSTGADPTSSGAPDGWRDAPPDPRRWWTLGAVCLGTFMLLLDITIVVVALPNIQAELHASFSDLQWIVDAYALTLASLLLTAGSLADIYGRRRFYVLGLGLFTLASLACGVSQSPLVLILSRAAQGIGGAIMFAVSLALLASAFRGRERGMAFGVWGAITGIAVAVGPVVGGALTAASWRWIFFVNLPIGVIAIVLTVLRVSESRMPSASRPDYPGVVTFTGALCLLVYALIRAGEQGFGESAVLGCFAGAAVLLAAFLLVEVHGTHPMFDLTLFRKPTFVGGSIIAFALSASIFSLQLYLVLYLQDVLRFSAFGTGLRLLVLSGGILATSAAAGRLTSHVPIRWLVGPGMILVGTGLLLFLRISADRSWTAMIPGLIVCGLGIGLTNPPLASTAVGVVEPRRAGMASGINSTFRQVGIATGIAVWGSLFASRTTAVLHDQLAHLPGASAVPALRGLPTAVRNGAAGPLIAHLPGPLQAAVGRAATVSFVAGLHHILVIGAIVAFVGGIAGLVLVRTKDLVGHGPADRPAAAQDTAVEPTV
jgi:EmrB/QacA subfamily drug resistance transporter